MQKTTIRITIEKSIKIARASERQGSHYRRTVRTRRVNRQHHRGEATMDITARKIGNSLRVAVASEATRRARKNTRGYLRKQCGDHHSTRALVSTDNGAWQRGEMKESGRDEKDRTNSMRKRCLTSRTDEGNQTQRGDTALHQERTKEYKQCGIAAHQERTKEFKYNEETQLYIFTRIG